jgi:hypothetical protein
MTVAILLSRGVFVTPPNKRDLIPTAAEADSGIPLSGEQ